MATQRKRPKSFEKGKKADRNTSDSRLIIVLVGAVILAFLMIYALIATMPAG